MKIAICNIFLFTLLTSCKTHSDKPNTVVELYELDSTYLNAQLIEIKKPEFDSLSILNNLIFDGNDYDSISYYKGRSQAFVAVLKTNFIGSKGYPYLRKRDTIALMANLVKTKNKFIQNNTDKFEYQISSNDEQFYIMINKIQAIKTIKNKDLITITRLFHINTLQYQTMLEIQINSDQMNSNHSEITNMMKSFVKYQQRREIIIDN